MIDVAISEYSISIEVFNSPSLDKAETHVVNVLNYLNKAYMAETTFSLYIIFGFLIIIGTVFAVRLFRRWNARSQVT